VTGERLRGPIELALEPLQYAWRRINLDPGGWADIDIYLTCPSSDTCLQKPHENCGCVITESTQAGIYDIDGMIARAVERYLADPRSKVEAKEFGKE